MARYTMPQLSEIVDGLKVLLRDGLPVKVPTGEPGALFKLKHVRARAGSSSLVDRTSALDWIVREVLSSFGDGPDGKALCALFALTPGARGLSLTERRQEAARLKDKHVDHWRKHIEPKLLTAMAQELHQRELLYRPKPEQVAPYRGELEPLPDSENPASLQRFEAESRIWGHVYLYRSELCAVRRLSITDSSDDLTAEKVCMALWEYARLLAAINRYMETYADKLVYNGHTVSMTTAVQIAGFHPPFTKQERDLLYFVLARTGERSPDDFLETLYRNEPGRAVLDKWSEWLTEGAITVTIGGRVKLTTQS